MGKWKPPKRMFKDRDVVHSYKHDRSAKARLKHVPEEHPDVLQNIEYILVRHARQDPDIDDQMLSRALRICINRSEPNEDDDPLVMELYEALQTMRDFRAEIPDSVWIECLRTVDDSIRRHSDRKPGERNYLEFIDEYIM